MTTTPFEITVNGTYTRDEIPPRCRKPRPVTYDTTATATVDAVTTTEAPVAFRTRNVIPEGSATEIRTHGGKLYAPYRAAARQEEPTIPGDTLFPSEIDENHHLSGYRLGRATTADEFSAAVANRFAPFLIIDGTVWAEADEPGYLVTTFGIGGYNGSTGLMVSTRKDHGTLFRADEFEQARAWAEEVAESRGDRADRYDDSESAEQYRAIEVLIPEAVTLVTIPPTPKNVRRLRYDYDTARRRLEGARTLDDETEAFQEVTRLREAIIQTGNTPVESDAQPYEARHGQQEN